MMFSVADILGGINIVTRTILSNATGTVLGMSEIGVKMVAATIKKVIGITAFGSTNQAVSKASELLRSKGYEVVVFHASGARADTRCKRKCFNLDCLRPQCSCLVRMGTN